MAMTRRQGWRGALLLAAFLLGLAGAAASALGAEDCCRDMHGGGGASCESIASAPCCGGPLAVHAVADTPAVPKPLIAAAVPQLSRPCLAARSAADAAHHRSAARLCRSVVLRL